MRHAVKKKTCDINSGASTSVDEDNPTAESRTVPITRPDVRRSVPTQLPFVPAAKPDAQLSAEEDRLVAQLADQPKI